MNGVLFVVLGTPPAGQTREPEIRKEGSETQRKEGGETRKGPWLLPPRAYHAIVELILQEDFDTPDTKTSTITLRQDRVEHQFTIKVYGTRTRYDISLQKGDEPPQPVSVFIAKRSGWRALTADTSQRAPSYASAEPKFTPVERRPFPLPLPRPTEAPRPHAERHAEKAQAKAASSERAQPDKHADKDE